MARVSVDRFVVKPPTSDEKPPKSSDQGTDQQTSENGTTGF